MRESLQEYGETKKECMYERKRERQLLCAYKNGSVGSRKFKIDNNTFYKQRVSEIVSKQQHKATRKKVKGH